MSKLRLPVGLAVCGLLAIALLVGRPVVQAQGAGPVLNPVQVVGPNVTFTWSAMAGASSYGLQAGVSPGAYLIGVGVGNTTTFSTTAPAPGVYFARIVALDASNNPIGASNEVSFQVTSMFVRPAAPSGLAVFLNGYTAGFSWTLGAGGGAPSHLLLQAGTSPGAADIASIPIGVGTAIAVPGVPPGAYYVRVLAANGAGASDPSNEVVVDMPPQGGCTAPPARAVDAFIFSTYARFSWAPIPGVLGYRLDFSTAPGGPTVVSVPVGPSTPFWSIVGAPLGTFYAKVTAVFACGASTTGPETAFTIDGLPPVGRPRAPNPTGPMPDNRLPLPNRLGVVNQVAREYPGDLRNSCREHGGNNNFLFRVVERLRQEDTRWGLNWKRTIVGDMSQDVITYNYGPDPDEGTRQVYVVDIIGGHCGSNPSAWWLDQTIVGSTGAQWTLVPYLNAGFVP